MNKTKAKAQVRHFQRNFFTRFGIEIGRKGMQQITEQIRGGRTDYLKKQSTRVSVHKIVYQEIKMIVFYDSNRKTLITVYPEEWWYSHENKTIDDNDLQIK